MIRSFNNCVEKFLWSNECENNFQAQKNTILHKF